MNFRVFYNRRSEAPQIWSIDWGSQSTELNVIGFRLHRCGAESKWDPNTPPNRDTPSAWLEITHAKLELKDGVAHFFHDLDSLEPMIEAEVNARLRELP